RDRHEEEQKQPQPSRSQQGIGRRPFAQPCPVPGYDVYIGWKMLFHWSSSSASLNTLYLCDLARSSAEGNTSGLFATRGSSIWLRTMSFAEGTGLTYQMKSASWAAIFGS